MNISKIKIERNVSEMRINKGFAPAKVNLFFEILGRRADGYHDVCSLCCPISVFDTIFFETQNCSEIEFCCQTENARQSIEDIPSDSNNIVVKAVQKVREKYGISDGCKIRLVKRIPSQAGMGGGSSDAATAIRLANRAWNLQMTQKDMIKIGAELGSDVPLFFMNGMSIGYGRGEIVEPISVNSTLHFVIVKPKEGISTAEAFRHCTQNIMSANDFSKRSPDELLSGLTKGNQTQIKNGLYNRLEQTAEILCPKIQKIREIFARFDCIGYQMTGSGTAYFGLCRHRRHAEHLAARLRLLTDGTVFTAQSITN